jgi:hypothetical protein
MALGRFRDDPEAMSEAECEVAAAQYPEGAHVVGMGLGMAVPMALAPSLVVLGQIAGGIAGFGAGR